MKGMVTLLLLGSMCCASAAVDIAAELPDGKKYIKVEESARLSDAVINLLSGSPQPYFWGGRVCSHQRGVLEQSRLQHVLDNLQYTAEKLRRSGSEEHAQRVLDMAEKLSEQGWQGCRFAWLEPGKMRIDIQLNPTIKEDLKLYLPKRPDSIRIWGAIDKDAQLKFSNGMAVTDYLASVEFISGLSERDYVLLIQPNGVVTEVSIAYWNMEPEFPAPGSVIWVAIDDSKLDRGMYSLNREIAALISGLPVDE